MTVPLHATPGFNFKAEVNYVASHYGVLASAMRGRASRERGQVMEARHALMWRLFHKIGLDERKIARLLDCKARTVREGIAQHQARIAHFRETTLFKPKTFQQRQGGNDHGQSDTRVLERGDRNPQGERGQG